MNRERRKALQAIVDQLETLQMQLEEIQTEEEEYRDNIRKPALLPTAQAAFSRRH